VWPDGKEVTEMVQATKACSQCGIELRHDPLEKDWFCPECDPLRAEKREQEAEEET
jgi:predicted Zn-ribbon and HTH transcriptional regulator